MAKQKKDRFDGYTVNVCLDDDGDWLAHFAEMPEVSAFAATAEEALNELAQAWAGVRLSFEKRNEQRTQPRKTEYEIAQELGVIGMDDDRRGDVAKNHSQYLRQALRKKAQPNQADRTPVCPVV